MFYFLASDFFADLVAAIQTLRKAEEVRGYPETPSHRD